jgi:tetratricopeptide (TPR) repeat protein
MVTNLIQKQVGLGKNVTFYLNNNTEVQGVLIEIGLEHVVIQMDLKVQTILGSMIGSWVVEDEASVVAISEKPVSPATIGSIGQNIVPDTKEILEKMLRIEANFDAQIENNGMQLIVPEIVIMKSEEKLLRDSQISTGWSKVRSKYDYALKVNEIGDKYGRMHNIVAELEGLLRLAPESLTFNRLLGYFYHFINNNSSSIICYKTAAMLSNATQDWHNLACVAIEHNENRLACVSLEKYFSIASPTSANGNWYVYTRLLIDTGFFPSNKFIEKNDSLNSRDWELIYETGIYFLIKRNYQDDAKSEIQKSMASEEQKELALTLWNKFDNQDENEYSSIRISLERNTRKSQGVKKANDQIDLPDQLEGEITDYIQNRSYAFIRGDNGMKFFFHLSGVVDNELRKNYMSGKNINGTRVTFEVKQSAKGPLAVGVSQCRSIDESYKLAKSYAENADYHLAIGQIKQVLGSSPDYKDAKKLLEKWREYARVTGVPAGSNPYAIAKRVQLVEKDLNRACGLFEKAIKEGDNIVSAIKDLVSLYMQLNEYEKAITLLEKYKTRIADPKYVSNMVVTIYYKMEDFDAAIQVLEKHLVSSKNRADEAQLSWMLANNYLKKENYHEAERYFRKAAEWQPDNLDIQRLIAYCLFNQQKLADARIIVKKLREEIPENQSVVSLMEAIDEAEQTGQIIDITIETTLVTLSSDISEFSKFILAQCAYKGISPEKISEDADTHKIYVGSARDLKFDMERLENFSKSLGTRRPFERAEYLLTAAKLSQDEGSDQFYIYLCRSLASRGDAAIVENRPLDSARSLYCEALAVYDGVREQRGGEQDAINAMVRYLFSTLGVSQVPMKPDVPNIDDTLESVIPLHPNQEKLFDLISYLLRHSRYASKKILNRLYAKTTLQVYATEYLRKKGAYTVSRQSNSLEEFVSMWNKLRAMDIDKERIIKDQLKILSNIELTTASLETGIEKLTGIELKIPFDLDKERIRNFTQILETAVDLKQEDVFEEQERLCQQIINRCSELIVEININPTELCVRDLVNIVQNFEKKVTVELSTLYESSTPQISLRMPVDSLIPDDEKMIEAQVVIENRRGCSPAEAVELIIVSQDEDIFRVENTDTMILPSSLRGGGHQYFRFPVRVTDTAIKSQAFSLPVYVQYETRMGDKISTAVENFSIRLYNEREFQEIDNPFARYAESSIVEDPNMFYGRDELIDNSSKAIINAGKQGKSIVIYGQKRAGKSSILYHLGQKLSQCPELLIVDLKNIASIIDRNSKYPFEYQLLWGIMNELNISVELMNSNSRNKLEFEFPSMADFYASPSSLVYFKDVLRRFTMRASENVYWEKKQIVLLIDEFSYIYEEILLGKIEPTFMKTWKALLQEKFFSVVLVGQDVMQKFKQTFPNEFGTTQDERVTYLRFEDAYRLIDEPIKILEKNGESRFRERAIDRIIELTSGSPYYIQILCNRLVETMNRKKAIYATEADVETIKNDLIVGVNSLGLDKFENLINSGDTSPDAIPDKDILKVLTAISINSKHGRCSESSLVLDTDVPPKEIIDDLVHRDIVERIDGHFYRIKVDLFKEWLIVHPQI